MDLFADLKPEDIQTNTLLKKLVETYIPYVEVDEVDDLNKVTDLVLGGPASMVVRRNR